VGVAYAVVLLIFLRNAPRPASGPDSERESVRLVPALVGLLRIGSFLLLVLYFTLPAIPGWLMKNWLPSILADKFALGQGQAGISATLYATLASLVGVLLGGVLADRWMRHTPRGRIYLSALGTVVSIPALFGVGYAPSLEVAIVFLIIWGLGWGFFDVNNMPILCQIVRPELRATGYGIMNMVSITVGGWATKRIGALRDAQVPASTIFTYCALAAAVSVILVILIRPKRALAPNATD
jgi:MFS transporter, Spinster family, sphingosine-1-phosphate transporter